jgi:hypothetical protein
MAERTGNPRAKSLDCVQKIAYSAELDMLDPCMNAPIKRTEKKTMDLAIDTAPRKVQLTDVRFSWQRETNIRAGRENVPTNVPKPFASTELMKLNFPAIYPSSMIPKHSTRAGYRLSSP